MDRRRSDLAAATCLAIVGLLLLGSAVALLVPRLPDLLGEDPHLAGDATMVVVVVIGPVATAGLLTLAPALALAWGVAGGRSLAMGWSILAGLAVAAILGITRGYLWSPFDLLIPIVALGAVLVAYLVLKGQTVGRGSAPRPRT